MGAAWVGRAPRGDERGAMTTTTLSTSRPPVEEMYVIHRAFRREFGLVPDLVRAVPEGDRARAEVVGDHLMLVLAGLHMHHTGEDEVLWPRLLERAAPDAELVGTMQAQHDRVDGYAERIGPLVGDWTRTGSAVRGEQLARLVEEFRTALLEHLDLEERAVLPLVTRHISAAEWREMGGDHSKEMSRQELPLMFGAILEDASPEERRMMLAPLPLPVRWLLRTVGARAYRKYVSRVRNG